MRGPEQRPNKPFHKQAGEVVIVLGIAILALGVAQANAKSDQAAYFVGIGSGFTIVGAVIYRGPKH